MDKGRKAYIYGLCEQGLEELRYIGSSVNPRARLWAHLRHNTAYYTERNPKFGEWLACCSGRINLVILEETTVENKRRREEVHIRLNREKGYRLFNKRSAAQRIYTKEEAQEVLLDYLSRFDGIGEPKPIYSV